MEYTEPQKQEFRALYAQRRRRQYLLVVPMVAALVALTFGADHASDTVLGLSRQIYVPLVFAGVAGALVFSYRNWRCPACNKYLGRSLFHRHCPNCGVGLV